MTCTIDRGLSARDLPAEPGDEPTIVHRDDGSWLLDGGLALDVVLRTLDTESLLSDDDQQQYHTFGGLAMLALGRVPRSDGSLRPCRRQIRIRIQPRCPVC